MADDQLNATLSALADPTRRAILTRLMAGDATVNELLEPFSISQPALSKHLKVLEGAGLISQRSDGPRRPRRLEAGPLVGVVKWLEDFRPHWEDSIQRQAEFADLLEDDGSITWS
ncbi:ArsR/SmtB family transcription factor [Kordiimonas sp.]|uniref:ArsR/SmtB family transcription factor n=1 Tax=Kordiimonas sp. TaxID=1970157 RepID=UPI003A8CFD8E